MQKGGRKEGCKDYPVLYDSPFQVGVARQHADEDYEKDVQNHVNHGFQSFKTGGPSINSYSRLNY
jgi:hypothetical protein